MTDQEFLELAAKAAGLEVKAAIVLVDGALKGLDVIDGGKVIHYWNPLADDGDALRLAVKLRMELGFEGDNVVFADGNFSEFLSEDPVVATRRAIVRAAAEIGQNTTA